MRVIPAGRAPGRPVSAAAAAAARRGTRRIRSQLTSPAVTAAATPTSSAATTAVCQPDGPTAVSRPLPSGPPANAASRPVAAGAPKRTTSRRGAAANDAISLLKSDHRQVEQWFEEFESARADGRKKDLAQKICQALQVHTQIEHEIFYPAFLEVTGEEDIHHEAEVEHDGAKKLIAEIESSGPADDYFDAKVKVLSEMIKHHVNEEEKRGGMFAKARESQMDLQSLGEQLARKGRAERLGRGRPRPPSGRGRQDSRAIGQVLEFGAPAWLLPAVEPWRRTSASAYPAGATRRGAASSIRAGCRSAPSWPMRPASLPSIEINGSFYSLQRPDCYASWYRRDARRISCSR